MKPSGMSRIFLTAGSSAHSSVVIAVATQLLRFAGPVATPGTDKIVRLVQPNAPQHQKWDPAFMPVFFDRQIDFTAAEPRPDLVVWPEASLPGFLHTKD